MNGLFAKGDRGVEGGPGKDLRSEKDLRRMKKVATGLLVVVACCYIAAAHLEASYPGLELAKVFAEAAVVGALADWFAVVALFRHPLGLPLPHTAVIPERKAEIGEGVAKFVKDNFLRPEVMRPQLKPMALASAMGSWLSKPNNAMLLRDNVAAFLDHVVAKADKTLLTEYLHRSANIALHDVPLMPLVGELIDLILAHGREQELISAALQIGREYFEKNRRRIRVQISRESPWWVPNFVDDEIFDNIIRETAQFFDDVDANPEHPMRIKLDHEIRQFADRLKGDPKIFERGEELKRRIISQPEVQEYVSRMGRRLGDYLLRESRDENSEVYSQITNGLVGLGHALKDNADLRAETDRWLIEGAMHVVQVYSETVGAVIAETFRRWDPEDASRRVELEIGKDLQYIRINGTLVGGIVGLGIHLVS